MKKLSSFWKIFIALISPIVIGTIFMYFSQFTEKADKSVIAYIGIGFYLLAVLLTLIFIGIGIYNFIKNK